MKPPPTDFQLLRAIYERHRGDYLTSIKKGGHAKIAVPIDIPAIAQDIGADADTVFGRLYHHLDPLYGTQNEDGSRKSSSSRSRGRRRTGSTSRFLRPRSPVFGSNVDAISGHFGSQSSPPGSRSARSSSRSLSPLRRPNRAPFAYPWRERVAEARAAAPPSREHAVDLAGVGADAQPSRIARYDGTASSSRCSRSSRTARLRARPSRSG